MRQKKEYDFVITLKHPDYKIYNIISVLMCIMTLAASVFGLLHSPFYNITWVNIFLMLVIVFNLVMALLNNKKENILTFKWALYAAAFYGCCSHCIFRSSVCFLLLRLCWSGK